MHLLWFLPAGWSLGAQTLLVLRVPLSPCYRKKTELYIVNVMFSLQIKYIRFWYQISTCLTHNITAKCRLQYWIETIVLTSQYIFYRWGAMSGGGQGKGGGAGLQIRYLPTFRTLAAKIQLQCWRYTSCEAPFIGVSSEFLRNKERSSAASSVPPLQSNQRATNGLQGTPSWRRAQIMCACAAWLLINV